MSKLNYSFLPIPRYFFESDWYKNPKMAIFILWCFGRCSTDRREVYHDHKLVVLEPFEFIFGLHICSEQTGLSIQTIRTLQQQLKNTEIGEILKKSTTKSTSKFTVYKWVTDLFSENRNKQINRQVTSNQQATNNNLDIRIKNKEYLPPLSPPKVSKPENPKFEEEDFFKRKDLIEKITLVPSEAKKFKNWKTSEIEMAIEKSKNIKPKKSYIGLIFDILKNQDAYPDHQEILSETKRLALKFIYEIRHNFPKAAEENEKLFATECLMVLEENGKWVQISLKNEQEAIKDIQKSLRILQNINDRSNTNDRSLDKHLVLA